MSIVAKTVRRPTSFSEEKLVPEMGESFYILIASNSQRNKRRVWRPLGRGGYFVWSRSVLVHVRNAVFQFIFVCPKNPTLTCGHGLRHV